MIYEAILNEILEVYDNLNNHCLQQWRAEKNLTIHNTLNLEEQESETMVGTGSPKLDSCRI